MQELLQDLSLPLVPDVDTFQVASTELYTTGFTLNIISKGSLFNNFHMSRTSINLYQNSL